MFRRGWTAGNLGRDLGVSPRCIQQRFAKDKAPAEAMMVMRWLSDRGRLTSVAEDSEAEGLRDAAAYRACREGLELSQRSLAEELRVTQATICNRELRRGLYMITREQAFALMLVRKNILRIRSGNPAPLDPPALLDRSHRLPSPANKRQDDWQRELLAMRPDHRARFDAIGRRIRRDGSLMGGGQTQDEYDAERRRLKLPWPVEPEYD